MSRWLFCLFTANRVHFGHRNKCHHLPGGYSRNWSVQVSLCNFTRTFPNCECFLVCTLLTCTHLSVCFLIPLFLSCYVLLLFPCITLTTLYRSIAVAVICCIVLVLPACSFGAVMCGSMDGGCGGLCPNRLRSPSQRSKPSDTAAKILIRYGTHFKCMESMS